MTCVGPESAVPINIRRKAVDLYNLVDRAKGEVTSLQSEMKNGIDHWSVQYKHLKQYFCRIKRQAYTDSDSEGDVEVVDDAESADFSLTEAWCCLCIKSYSVFSFHAQYPKYVIKC